MDNEIVFFLNYVFDQTYGEKDRPDFDEFCNNYLKYMSEVQAGAAEATDVLNDAFGILTKRLTEASQEDSPQFHGLSAVEELLDADELLQSQS